MIKVLCTGPESSGTRLLTRLVSGLGVKAEHRSIPHAQSWWDEPPGITHVISIVRDPFITQISAVEAGHFKHWSGVDASFPYRITHAWEVLVTNASKFGGNWMPLTYEGLIMHPQWTMDSVADFLEVQRRPITEKIVDPRKDYFDG